MRIDVHKRQLVTGIVLCVFTFFMPIFFNVHNLNILEALFLALERQNETYLVLAGIRLVFLNALRSLPHYVGSFFIGTSFEIRSQNKNIWIINAILMISILQFTYFGIAFVHHVHYDYGIPAVIVSSLIILSGRFDHQYISPAKKTLQSILFITAFQFLDIMPAVSALPVGRGETSMDIKMAAYLIDGEAILNLIGIGGCIIFLLFGLLVFFQLRDENHLRKLVALKHNMNLKEIDNRTFIEVKHLVHDLKSPLTAMQMLVGILKMRSEADNRLKDINYLDRIENGIEKIDEMITQILYEDQSNIITTKELLQLALSQISVTPYADFVKSKNYIPAAKIKVNKFLFSRAIINLTQNSSNAIPEGTTPQINITVKQIKEYVYFIVSDNGRGIKPEHREIIWEDSISSGGSSGLGLKFVRDVVQKLDGELSLKSVVGEGTTIEIRLPRC